MVGPGEGKGSCLTCRAEMCRAKTCRAAHVINSMDVRAHDKPGLSPTVFSLIKTLFFFFFPPKKKGTCNNIVAALLQKSKSCNNFIAAMPFEPLFPLFARFFLKIFFFRKKHIFVEKKIVIKNDVSQNRNESTDVSGLTSTVRKNIAKISIRKNFTRNFANNSEAMHRSKT